MVEKVFVGTITHFFPKISVVVIELEDKLKVGDKISIETDAEAVEQMVSSMQIDRVDVSEAGKGQAIGMKVEKQAKTGAKVFKIVE